MPRIHCTDDLSENQGVMDNRNHIMLKISTYRRHRDPHCIRQAERQESPELD